jgi:hypothetical protein
VLAHLVYHHELYVALVEACVAGTPAQPPAGTFRELNAQAVAANAGVPAPALVARLSKILFRGQEANRRLERLYLVHNPHAVVVEIKAGARPRTLAALVPEVEAHIRNHLLKLQPIAAGRGPGDDRALRRRIPGLSPSRAVPHPGAEE